MKILFKKIDIENFMSLGDASVLLDDAGYTLVSGINNNPDDLAKSNGSGKSSIFEAIVWCLTGDTMRGNKNIVNQNRDGGTAVTLEFDCDGKSYVLLRSKEHSVHKTNLKIMINGEDKSGKGIRDSEKLLAEYLPDLTPSLIGSVIILGQGLPNRFTHNSPSGRKDVLEKLCKSDFMIQDLKDRISSRKTELSNLLRTAEDDILQNNTKLTVAIESLGKYKVELLELQHQTSFDEDILEAHRKLNTLNEEQTDNATKYEQLQTQHDAIVELQRLLVAEKYAALEAVRLEYNPKIEEAKKDVSETQLKLNAARAELSRLQSITDVCPTCGQKLPDVQKPDTTDVENSINTYNNEILRLGEVQRSITEQFNTAQTNVSKQFEEKDIAYSKDIRTLKGAMNDLYGLNVQIQYRIRELESEIQRLVLRKENHSESLRKVGESIETTEHNIKLYESEIERSNQLKADYQSRLDIISKFNTAVTRDFRGYLLSNVITFINETAKKYSQSIFETDLIEFTLDGNNISISYAGKEYEALSGGERQKVDLIVQFSIREMLCFHTGFSTNLIVLDEIFDNLDDLGCSKVIDLIADKLVDISSIYIITHHNSYLNIPCDAELTIVKDASGVSYLQ